MGATLIVILFSFVGSVNINERTAGGDIIAVFSLLIKELSEDALETRHEDVKKNRLHHTCQF